MRRECSLACATLVATPKDFQAAAAEQSAATAEADEAITCQASIDMASLSEW